MRAFITFIGSILMSVFIVSGQDYGVEWIDFDRDYIKLQTVEEGIYRVSYGDLADFLPASADPRSFKLWRRGEEQAITVTGASDGSFDAGDYIEFYGQKNNGELERELYKPSSAQPHPHYSVYSDSAAYFLSWGGVSGQRISTHNPGSSGAVAPELISGHQMKVLHDQYSMGDESIEYVFKSHGDVGEGWCGRATRKGDSHEIFLENLDGHAQSDHYTLEVLVIGRNGSEHDVELRIGENNTITHDVPSFNRYNTQKVMIPVSGNQVHNNRMRVEMFVRGGAAQNDFASLGYVRLHYEVSPELSADQHTFEVSAPEGQLTQINWPASISNYQVWDITKPASIRNIAVNGSDVSNINPSADTTTLFLRRNGVYKTVERISEVAFTNDMLVNPDYLILTHQRYKEAAEEYAQYRATPEGGGYSPYVVTIDRLFDQYQYGEKSPLAVRKFCRMMIDNKPVKFLYIIGKPVAPDYRKNGKYYRDQTPEEIDQLVSSGEFGFKDDVLSGGHPGSDIAFTSGLGGEPEFIPALATGRLSVTSSEEVINYLDKIKEHEQLSYNELWPKNLIHLSGGKTENEINLFRNYMNSYANIAEGPVLGGNVTTYTKESNETVAFFNISEPVNEGVSMISYFGHSAPRFIEIDIGQVSEEINGYDNKGKYPILYMNGCHAGDIFVDYTHAEDWLNTRDKGAIAAFAHTAYGYSGQLNTYCKGFYELAMQDSATASQPLGVVQKKTIDAFLGPSNNPANSIYQTQAQQFIMLGDPALRYFPVEKPDYAITDEDVFIEREPGETITAESPIQLGIVISNLGRAVSDSVDLCITRSFNNNQETREYTYRISPVHYRDTVYVEIPGEDVEAAGDHLFLVQVNCNEGIDERNMNNNSAFYEVFLPARGVQPLFPKEFAVIGEEEVDFVAQPYDLFTVDQQFVMELDTAPDFSSALKVQRETTADNLVRWENEPLPVTEDSTVYFWRAGFLEDGEDTPEVWTNSSFTYIEGQHGWGQMRLEQYYKNAISGMSADSTRGKLVFDTTSSRIILRSPGSGVEDYPEKINLNIDGQALIVGGERGSCVSNGMFAVSLDGQSALPYHPDGVGGGNCGTSPSIAVSYNTNNNNGQNNLYNYIDALPASDYLVLFSGGETSYESFPDSLVQLIDEYGTTQLDQLVSGQPYALIAKRGQTPLLELTGEDVNSIVADTLTIEGKRSTGTVSSTLIGPGANWNMVYKNTPSPHDDLFVEVYGVNAEGSDSLLFTIPGAGDDSLDITDIDDEEFPYLRLRAYLTDSTGNAASWLKNWLVLFDPLPEGFINPVDVDVVGSYEPESRLEGAPMDIPFVFENITSLPFEGELTARYTIRNLKSGRTRVIEENIGELGPQGRIDFSHKFDTDSLIGENQLTVYVNPEYLPETYYNNNVLQLNFNVDRDNSNPLLEVTFDGEHITDGQQVSGSAEIMFTLKDNNPYKYKDDTTGVQLYIMSPCGEPDCPFERIYFSDPRISWEPAGPGKDFTVYFRPEGLEEGEYLLRFNAPDASGNMAGSVPHEIGFTVDNKPTITNFFPYPNPFSTSTRFVFTVTGTHPPEDFILRIMTIDGTVIREVPSHEFGPVKVGHNISEFAWDGTDERGQQMANGVYLYTVIFGDDEDFELKTTKGDKSMKRGYGKIYLMRGL